MKRPKDKKGRLAVPPSVIPPLVVPPSVVLASKVPALVVPGINPVEETLNSHPGAITEIWSVRGASSPRIKAIMERAYGLSIPFKLKEKEDFQAFSHLNHQGIVAFLTSFPYKAFQKLKRDLELETNPVLLALDHITDEGNLGSIIRTACFFGVNGIILPKDRTAKISPTVIKRSSGACMKVDLVMVTNLHMAMRELKDLGYWIVGSVSKGGVSIYELDLVRPLVIIMGSESKGISPILKKVSDVHITIPGRPDVDSLNVAVAAGIILSQVQRQRLAMGRK